MSAADVYDYYDSILWHYVHDTPSPMPFVRTLLKMQLCAAVHQETYFPALCRLALHH